MLVESISLDQCLLTQPSEKLECNKEMSIEFELSSKNACWLKEVCLSLAHRVYSFVDLAFNWCNAVQLLLNVNM